jgi:CHASE3 domain sensor protein
VYVLVGGMLVLLLITVTATVAARLYVISLDNRILGALRPAQAEIAELTQGYIDMETGERGYLLTRETQLLAPYDTGQSEVSSANARLAEELAGDSVGTHLLTVVADAGTSWRQQAAEPEIAGARDDTLAGTALVRSVVTGKQLFGTLRNGLTALQNRINQLTTTAVQSANAIQSQATLVSIICAALALLVGGATFVLVRRSLADPITRLLREVRRVSDGQLDQPVDVTGPSEVESIALAVEGLRQRIRDQIASAETAAGQVARLAEADRIAHDIGNRVSNQLFGASLAAQSAAGRHPRARPAFIDITRRIDTALRELRLAMYGQPPATSRPAPLVARLTEQLRRVARPDAEPDVRVSGDLDRAVPDSVAAELLAVAVDTIGSVVGPDTTDPPEIDLSVENDTMRLHIVIARPANGHAGLLAGFVERVARLDGDVTVDNIAHEGTPRFVLDWRVPLTGRGDR